MSWRRVMSIHGHKYLIEGLLMAVFMMVLAVAGTLIEHPDFAVRQVVEAAWARRALMGMVAGGTLIGLIYSPWGQESGAHLNPAVTFAYWQIGKIGYRSALAYIVAQCLGALVGMASGALLMDEAIADPSVQYLATEPGRWGVFGAFVAEWALSFMLMAIVRITALSPRWSNYTGLCVGLFVSFFVCVESPISGMSLNPARTLSSSILAGHARGVWIYFVAPPLGMLCAAQALRLMLRALGRPTRWVVTHAQPTLLIFRKRRLAAAAAAEMKANAPAQPDSRDDVSR